MTGAIQLTPCKATIAYCSIVFRNTWARCVGTEQSYWR